jgi:DNA primase catalytic subunit
MNAMGGRPEQDGMEESKRRKFVAELWFDLDQHATANCREFWNAVAPVCLHLRILPLSFKSDGLIF